MSVVLPVHNQADHIAASCAAISAALERIGLTHELVLAATASRDETPAVCESLAAHDPQVRVVLDAGRLGACGQAGLRAARGDLLCYTNSARTRRGS